MEPMIGHVGLNVTNLDRSKQFYSELLEFTVIREAEKNGSRFAYLGRNGDVSLTLWQQSSRRFDHNAAGLHHLAFKVSSADDLKLAESKLVKLKARIFHGGIVLHAEGRQSGGLFFEDPDGIRIEISTSMGVEGEAPYGASPTCGFF